ncbi:MAG: SDR family oxidoreductase [Verrucomicrobiota bacterium]
MNRPSHRNSLFKEKYGPWAVVTGASSGIGREIAVQLAEAGIHLILVARRFEILIGLVEDLRKAHGIDAKPLALDLGRESATTELASATEGIDVGLFVAAAGFGSSGRFIESPIERELDMLSVNCRVVLAQAHHFGRRFAERGRGGLILMGSIVGFQGTPMASHYAATKAYIQSFAEALHSELAPSGVDVLSSAPGPTNSEFADRAGMKMGKALDPAEVARQTLRALGTRSTVLPGVLTKFLTYSLALLPRWARVRVMGKVMSGMTRQEGDNPETVPTKTLAEPS